MATVVLFGISTLVVCFSRPSHLFEFYMHFPSFFNCGLPSLPLVGAGFYVPDIFRNEAFTSAFFSQPPTSLFRPLSIHTFLSLLNLSHNFVPIHQN
jgi:hypothetical protein